MAIWTTRSPIHCTLAFSRTLCYATQIHYNRLEGFPSLLMDLIDNPSLAREARGLGLHSWPGAYLGCTDFFEVATVLLHTSFYNKFH